MKRTPIIAISALLLAGCTADMGINSRGHNFYQRYLTVTDYKALAITPSSYRDGFSMAFGHDRFSVRSAIKDAMERCEERAKPRGLGKCRLHSIGDINVTAMDDAALEEAIARYQSEGKPAAYSLSRQPSPPKQSISADLRKRIDSYISNNKRQFETDLDNYAWVNFNSNEPRRPGRAQLISYSIYSGSDSRMVLRLVYTHGALRLDTQRRTFELEWADDRLAFVGHL